MVCPWCYVGYKRLQSAISQFHGSNHKFTIEWHPYQLNPHAPERSMDKLEYYAGRFGADRAAAMHEHMRRVGLANDIAFSFGGRTGNTRDSHRLVQFAKQHRSDRQTALVEKLFSAYFEHEKDITLHDVLVQAAVDAGLDGSAAREWLADGSAGGAVVDREVGDARGKKGISGVPDFTINGKRRISGAQEPEQFVDIFRELAAAAAE